MIVLMGDDGYRIIIINILRDNQFGCLEVNAAEDITQALTNFHRRVYLNYYYNFLPNLKVKLDWRKGDVKSEGGNRKLFCIADADITWPSIR